MLHFLCRKLHFLSQPSFFFNKITSRHKKKKLFTSVMPAGWRQSSVGSSTPAAELMAVVGTKVGALCMRPTDLTRGSQATVLLGLHPLHCSCCEVKTVNLSPFGVRDCPILILHMVLRITGLIVVVSICPGLVHVGSRVPVALRLGILLIASVVLVNHWLKFLCRFNFVLFLQMLLEFGNHVFWTW